MGIQIGNITNNGESVSPGIIIGGKQLQCRCGNTTVWGDITAINEHVTAECGVCRTTVCA
jgi:hypothetical protein